MQFEVKSSDGVALGEVDAADASDAVAQVSAWWIGGPPACFGSLTAEPVEERSIVRIKPERKTRQAYPDVRVKTSWMMCDWEHEGISLEAANAATGNVLSASLDDEALAAKDDAAIMAWAARCVAEYARR